MATFHRATRPSPIRRTLYCSVLHRHLSPPNLSVILARPLSTAAPSASTAALSASTTNLPLVYQHDRSSYYRRLTIAAAASLCVVWLPLCYVSLVMTSPPMYSTLLGPLAAVATLVATHFRASRIIRSIHRTPAGLLVHTYTALGQPHPIGLVTYNNVKPITATNSNKHYWIVSLAGHKRYFLIDRHGTVHDTDAMRRVVGYGELDTEEDRLRKQRDGIRGPGTLGRLQHRR